MHEATSIVKKLLFFPSSRSSDPMLFADTKSHQILSRKPGNIGNDSKSAFPSFVEQLQFVKVAKTTKDNGWHFLEVCQSLSLP